MKKFLIITLIVSLFAAIIISLFMYVSNHYLVGKQSHYEIRCIANQKPILIQRNCDKVEVHCVEKNGEKCAPAEFIPNAVPPVVKK